MDCNLQVNYMKVKFLVIAKHLVAVKHYLDLVHTAHHSFVGICN
jgi:hypothetical protein